MTDKEKIQKAIIDACVATFCFAAFHDKVKLSDVREYVKNRGRFPPGELHYFANMRLR